MSRRSAGKTPESTMEPDAGPAAGAPAAPGRGLPRLLPVVAGAVAAAAVLSLVLWQAGVFPFGAGRPQTAGGEPPAPAIAEAAAAIDGRWRGEVAYDWGARQEETFTFRTIGGVLTGSAGFLGTGRTILEGTGQGSNIRFVTRWTETLGSEQRSVINHYAGTLSGDKIRMVLSMDGGFGSHVPVEFTLRRAPE
jgi:hypothetical protein